MPQVSVLVICHNYGQYLDQCLESLMIQKYKDFEVIVVSTGTDNSHEVAAKYPVTNHILRPDHGISTTRNYAVSQAKGDLLVNVDADDWVSMLFLRELVSIAGQGKIAAPMAIRYFGDLSTIGMANGPFSLSDFLMQNRIWACSMFHKEDFYTAGRYDDKLDNLGYEDWDLWIRLVQNGCKVVTVPHILYNYRVHLGSHSDRMKPREADRINYIRAKYAHRG